MLKMRGGDSAPSRRPEPGEGGYTLVEVLVATALAIGLLGTAGMLFTTSIQSQPKASTRTMHLQQARTTVERLTRELRQGSTVSSGSAAQLSIITYVPRATCGGPAADTSRQCRVTYTCSAGTCSRVEANPDGTSQGPSTVVVTGLADTNVFSYSPSVTSPTFVGVRMSFDAGDGEDSITLEDGVALRNPGTV
jgi:Tfp pilus assembly protein PilV